MILQIMKTVKIRILVRIVMVNTAIVLVIIINIAIVLTTIRTLKVSIIATGLVITRREIIVIVVMIIVPG